MAGCKPALILQGARFRFDNILRSQGNVRQIDYTKLSRRLCRTLLVSRITNDPSIQVQDRSGQIVCESLTSVHVCAVVLRFSVPEATDW